jgi:hypothetical protein
MGRKGRRRGGKGYGAKEAPLGGGVPGRHDLYTSLAMFVLALSSAVMGRAACPVEADPMEQALATVRDCMARSPAPWADAWNREYGDTIREAITSHKDAPQLEARLRVLCDGFPAYWERLEKSQERSIFDVQRAQIRWYVEYLMEQGFPGDEERQWLRQQYRALGEYGARALLAQFPFLDPNMVEKARADCLDDWYRNIEAPLLPIFLRSLSEGQVEQITQRWHDLRYARVDLWRQLDRGQTDRGSSSAKADAYYLLGQLSLRQLEAQVWAVAAGPPGYYRRAVADRSSIQHARLRARFEAGNQERRLPVVVLQTEYISFLLSALLETGDSLQEEGKGMGGRE